MTDLAAMQGRAPRIDELVEHAAAMPRDPDLVGLDDHDVEQRLVTQTMRVAAETSRWLDLLAEAVIRGIWADQGARTPTAWLSWRLGIAPSTAREHIRVALRLRELPRIHARFAAGSLSYSKVRALTRIAVPELEQLLLNWSDQATGADLDRIAKGVAQARRAAADESRPHAEERAAARAGLDVVFADDGGVELRWRLDAVDGMEVLSILDRLSELEDEAEAGRTESDGPAAASPSMTAAPSMKPAPSMTTAGRSHRCRQGRLLFHLLVAARDATPPDTSGVDRHTLVVQVAAEDLVGESRRRVPVEVAGPRHARPVMQVSVLRRLACDAGVVLVPTAPTSPGGGRRTPIDVGRRKRQPTAALRRALRLRDRACRFPGCGATRHLHAHHVVHWADDGPTDLGNLVLLCGFHHRKIHEPGWSMSFTVDGEVEVRPAPSSHDTSVGPVKPSLPLVPRLSGSDAGDGGPPGGLDERGPHGRILVSASAEAPDLPDLPSPPDLPDFPDPLAPRYWSADDPLQIDLLIAILEQELAHGPGQRWAAVA